MSKTRIPKPVLGELNRQLNDELAAAHNYLALSLWCADHNLKGFAGFFTKQAAEEREHADKIVAHLIDRQALPDLAPIAAPNQKFASLLEVAQHARIMEQNNTAGINAVYEAAVTARDYPAQVLMHWFINEQVEEEAWATEIVERIQNATCAGSLFDLDRHISKVLEGDATGS
jgi:ferritin